MRNMIFVLAMVVAAPVLVSAQTADDHVAMGIKAYEALKPEEALQHFEAALAIDSLNYEANWRAAAVAVEVAQRAGVNAAGYKPAEAYARRAFAIDQTKAESHFVVAYALGARSLVMGSMGRLGIAREIWQEASDAILIDPKHDGAYHVLGEWYAQVMRLSRFERGFANGSLGDIARNATWMLAIENLEKAVELAPTFIYHRLDLARAYHGKGFDDEARAQLAVIDTLPITHSRDPTYKAKAKTLLSRLAAKP